MKSQFTGVVAMPCNVLFDTTRLRGPLRSPTVTHHHMNTLGRPRLWLLGRGGRTLRQSGRIVRYWRSLLLRLLSKEFAVGVVRRLIGSGQLLALLYHRDLSFFIFAHLGSSLGPLFRASVARGRPMTPFNTQLVELMCIAVLSFLLCYLTLMIVKAVRPLIHEGRCRAGPFRWAPTTSLSPFLSASFLQRNSDRGRRFWGSIVVSTTGLLAMALLRSPKEMPGFMEVSVEVAEAIANNKPVVALESTIITHGELAEFRLNAIGYP